MMKGALSECKWQKSNIIDQKKEQFIILESNFRILAYTSSNLALQILSKIYIYIYIENFVSLEYNFPGLLIGTLKQRSVCNAYKKGIKSKQIINYIENHAHPSMHIGRETENIDYKEKIPDEIYSSDILFPENVRQQLIIWENEYSCISGEMEGTLLTDFDSIEHFASVLKETKKQGIFRYSSKSSRSIFVQNVNHQLISEILAK